MDTLTKSCSPTIVITANGEVQTHEEATVYVKELDLFLTMEVLEDTPEVLSLGKLCDSVKTGFGYNATRRTSFLSWFQACQQVLPPVHPSTSMTPSRQERHCSTSSSSSSSSPTTATSSDSETRETEDQSEIVPSSACVKFKC